MIMKTYYTSSMNLVYFELSLLMHNEDHDPGQSPLSLSRDSLGSSINMFVTKRSPCLKGIRAVLRDMTELTTTKQVQRRRYKRECPTT